MVIRMYDGIVLACFPGIERYIQGAFRDIFDRNFYSMYIFTNRDDTGLDAYVRHSRQRPTWRYWQYSFEGVHLCGSFNRGCLVWFFSMLVKITLSGVLHFYGVTDPMRWWMAGAPVFIGMFDDLYGSVVSLGL
jgi:hypothetical protein